MFRYSSRRILTNVESKRFSRRRGPFGPEPRNFEEKNYMALHQHDDKNLKLAEPIKNRPDQWRLREQPKEKNIVTKERKLTSLKDEQPQYMPHSKDQINIIQDFGTYFDPLFNPLLHQERDRVNPDEEPFNAIYANQTLPKGEKDQFTNVENVTTPELWTYVERLARIRVPPIPRQRKPHEPVTSLPSGYVPPPEVLPDLPYCISRTRNHLLPVYYRLDNEEEKCYTSVKYVSGDLWKFESDMRVHLEKLNQSKTRIMTSVHETDGRVLFRGKHLKEIVDWLHQKGF